MLKHAASSIQSVQVAIAAQVELRSLTNANKSSNRNHLASDENIREFIHCSLRCTWSDGHRPSAYLYHTPHRIDIVHPPLISMNLIIMNQKGNVFAMTSREGNTLCDDLCARAMPPHSFIVMSREMIFFRRQYLCNHLCHVSCLET